MLFNENDVVITDRHKVASVSFAIDKSSEDPMYVLAGDVDSDLVYGNEIRMFKDHIDEYLEHLKPFPPESRCKHWNQELEKTWALIQILYSEYNEVCGGLLHVLIDDDNFDDGTVKWSIDYCQEEEHKYCPSRNVSLKIAERFLTHTFQERVCMSHHELAECQKHDDSHCKSCYVETIPDETAWRNRQLN
jgi:hypothetical protein